MQTSSHQNCDPVIQMLQVKTGKASPTTRGIEIAPRVLWTIRLLLAVAIVVDGYLAWVSLGSGTVAGCGPNSSCHFVLNSRWGYWFGVPISVPALGFYASALAATFWLSPDMPVARRRNAWGYLLLCSVVILGAGSWFIWIQIIVLNTICPFCMAAHGSALMAALNILATAPVRRSNQALPDQKATAQKRSHLGASGKARKKKPGASRPGNPEVFVPLKLTFQLAAVALMGLGALIAGQLLHQPKSYASAAIAAGITTNTPARAERWFQVLDGEFQFNLSEVPMLGRMDAPHAMINLFDYTCHHCRELHTPLLEAVGRFSNDLAVVNLPMPLDGQCNPLVRFTPPPHTNACALARIGLAVWRADRQLSPKFDHWMFTGNQAPLPEEAEQHARQLVGAGSFDAAMQDAWIGQLIQTNIALFQASAQRLRKAVLPQLIIGTNLTAGMVPRDHLFRLLSEQFGLTEEANQLSGE
jgi:uncharacterized membrane protein